MSSTDSTRSRRIVFSLTDHCDGELLYPPCRFESWAMLQHCGGSFAEILGGMQCQKASHCGEMIGELNAIRSTITDRIPGAQCVMLTLCLKSKFESYGKEPKIVLATSVNPKIVGDNPDVFVDKPEYLSCGEGDFVVNDVIALLPQMKNNSLVSEPTKNYERRGVWPSLYSTTVITSLRGHGADQKASSSKLNQFIVTADTQIIEFLCTAKVTGIQHDDGIDAKVGKTCNDASTAKRAPSSKEQVAEKSRVE
uniref:Uncharacterized protein n=1 Tax=Brassica oleracea TaxID=3712 RepID=A0A3P6B254_BRAOL|nr:unnamed protein product [Brassica oleracea]